MRVLPILLAGTCLSVAALTCRAESFSFFTEQFPPYNMTADGQGFAHKATDIDGLCTDIVRSIMDKTQHQYRIKLRNWAFGMDRVERNVNHGLFCTVRTPEREQRFQWVGPLTAMHWALFARPDSTITLESLKDAKSYVIGGYKGDAMTNWLVQQGLNVSVIPDDKLNPQRLQQGSIDLWLTDTLAGPFKAADNTDMRTLKRVLLLETTPVYLAMNPQTDPKLVQELNDVLNELKASGKIDQMEQQYGH